MEGTAREAVHRGSKISVPRTPRARFRQPWHETPLHVLGMLTQHATVSEFAALR
jgi:hypothetical protein